MRAQMYLKQLCLSEAINHISGIDILKLQQTHVSAKQWAFYHHLLLLSSPKASLDKDRFPPHLHTMCSTYIFTNTPYYECFCLNTDCSCRSITNLTETPVQFLVILVVLNLPQFVVRPVQAILGKAYCNSNNESQIATNFTRHSLSQQQPQDASASFQTPRKPEMKEKISKSLCMLLLPCKRHILALFTCLWLSVTSGSPFQDNGHHLYAKKA